MFATSKTFNQNMTTVLLTLLPPAFDTVSNAMRAAPPATWQEVVARLRDYDSASRQEKQEVQGHVYAALQKEVTELRALVVKSGKGGKGRRQKKTCWKCGKSGHLQAHCNVKDEVKSVKKKTKGKGKF